MTNPINNLLLQLLTDFERIGDDHEELFDSEVRQQAGNALMAAFVRQTDGYDIPSSLGMFSEPANDALRTAIKKFVDGAIPVCQKHEIRLFHARLECLQDSTVLTPRGNDYEEFIGHTPPDWYDEEGNVLWDRVR